MVKGGANTRIHLLMRVFAAMPPEEGWVCTGLTNRKVMLSHSLYGRRVCWVDGGGRVGIRAPEEMETSA